MRQLAIAANGDAAHGDAACASPRPSAQTCRDTPVGLAQNHRHHDAYRRARWGGGGKALLHMQSDARNLRELPRRGGLEIKVSESNGSSGLNRSGGVAVSREARQGQGTPQCLHGLERHGHGCRGPAPRTGGHAGARRSHPPRRTPQRCPAPQRDFGVCGVCVWERVEWAEGSRVGLWAGAARTKIVAAWVPLFADAHSREHTCTHTRICMQARAHAQTLARCQRADTHRRRCWPRRAV